jgi:ribonuclease J
MMVYEYDGQMLIVDAGLMFPKMIVGDRLLIPDFEYVLANRDRFVAWSSPMVTKTTRVLSTT